MDQSTTTEGRASASASTRGNEADYWNSLLHERAAAAFLSVTDRTMQVWRQRGGGPKFIRLSSRCIRYRRADLVQWADARARASTSDPGQKPSPAAT